MVLYGSEEVAQPTDHGNGGGAYVRNIGAGVEKHVIAGESDFGADRVYALRLPAGHPVFFASSAAVLALLVRLAGPSVGDQFGQLADALPGVPALEPWCEAALAATAETEPEALGQALARLPQPEGTPEQVAEAFAAGAREQGASVIDAGLTSTDALWLMAAGPVTLIPLLGFNAAARHLPYSTLGFLQYLTPTLLLILAVQLFGEPFPVDRQLAFFCIWAGLAVYSLDAWRVMRKSTG
mgnify:CR=1 FL=1